MTCEKKTLHRGVAYDIHSAWTQGMRGATGREKFALIVFILTCFQAAFLYPNLALVPGERAKLFTGLLCALSLLLAFVLTKNRANYGTRLEFILSVVLASLIALSSILSSTPLSSSFRGFVVAAAGLGGFWCARLLLSLGARQALFTWLCTVLLASMVGLAIDGYLISGNITSFLDVNPHPVAARMLILCFAPLTLILCGTRRKMQLGVLLLGLTYLVFYLSSLRAAMLIPIVLGFVAACFGALSFRRFALALIPLALIMVCFFYYLPNWKLGLDYEPAYYRAENYPFSFHIASKHPFLGIGLRAPREEYLDDYQLKYPYVTREKFAESVKGIVSSENIFLTFMAELGFPFLVLYTIAVGAIVLRLWHFVRCKQQTSFLPPLPVLLAIIGALLHFQVLDGLLHPQVSWFFHILLGLVPRSQDTSENR